MVMISSAALPKRRVEQPADHGPVRAAISGGAPISPASGMIASADVTKIATSPPPYARQDHRHHGKHEKAVQIQKLLQIK